MYYTGGMIKTINATKFRNNFKDTMDHVKKSKKPLIITDRDVPSAILIDIDEFTGKARNIQRFREEVIR
mgnify:CR=1 FL=1